MYIIYRYKPESGPHMFEYLCEDWQWRDILDVQDPETPLSVFVTVETIEDMLRDSKYLYPTYEYDIQRIGQLT